MKNTDNLSSKIERHVSNAVERYLSDIKQKEISQSELDMIIFVAAELYHFGRHEAKNQNAAWLKSQSQWVHSQTQVDNDPFIEGGARALAAAAAAIQSDS